MPLTFASIGQVHKIIKVKGQEKSKKFMESLGFVEGADVQVISFHGGHMIVNIKESRIAINQEMASKILIKGA